MSIWITLIGSKVQWKRSLLSVCDVLRKSKSEARMMNLREATKFIGIHDSTISLNNPNPDPSYVFGPGLFGYLLEPPRTHLFHDSYRKM